MCVCMKEEISVSGKCDKGSPKSGAEEGDGIAFGGEELGRT